MFNVSFLVKIVLARNTTYSYIVVGDIEKGYILILSISITCELNLYKSKYKYFFKVWNINYHFHFQSLKYKSSSSSFSYILRYKDIVSFNQLARAQIISNVFGS